MNHYGSKVLKRQPENGDPPIRQLAARMAEVRPFHVMALLGRARELEAQGRDIVHLEVGEPDFITPEAVCNRGIQALTAGRTHYTPAAGLPELRQKISAWYGQRYELSVPADRIMITPGASGALSILAPCLFGPGDEVLLPDPGYPCNRNFVLATGAQPVMVPVGSQERWQLTPERIRSAWNEHTRAVILASPSNPTGSVLSAAEITAVADCVRQLGGILIVDEIYQGLQYEGDACSALQCSEDVFVVNSFSKFFGMTGWRVGWLVTPDWAREPLERLAQNLYLAAPTVAQHAALAAFEPDVQAQLELRRQEFQARRDFLLDALSGTPLEAAGIPAGAFYLYMRLAGDRGDAVELCSHLLEEHGVAITPGADFGDHLAGQHVRLAYTTNTGRLAEGVRRIRQALT